MAELKDAMLTYLPNPLLTDNRKEYNLSFIEGETLSSYLSRAGIEIYDGHPVVVFINDEKLVSGWEDYVIKNNDVINVRAAVRGKAGQIIGMIALVAISIYFPPALAAAGGFAVGTVGSALVTAAVLVGASLVINSLVPPPSARGGGNAQEVNEQKRYVISGLKNSIRLFEPMMIVIGKMRVFPDVASNFYTEFINSEQYLYQAFNFGIQSDLTLTDFRIGTADVSNYNNINIQTAGADGVLPEKFGNIDTIQGVEIKKSDGWVSRSTKGHTVGLELDFQVIAFDTLDEGGVESKSIAVSIEVYTIAADGTQTRYDTLTLSLTGMKISSVRTTHRIHINDSGEYLVKVRKTSIDVESTKKTRRLSWVSLKAFQEDSADYSGQRRVGVSIKASGQLSGQVDQFNAICQSTIPVWTGSTWVKQFTSNPAWWLLWWFRGSKDSAGRRQYGAGLPDSRIDMDSIKAFAAWCNRKNLECNAVINSSQSVKNVAEIISRCGRGQTTWQTGKYGVIWDADDLSHIAVFSPSNIKSGTFSIDYVSGKLADEFIVNFKNADSNWAAESVRATVGGISDPDNPVEIDFIGCTNKDQAGREASLLAASQEFFKRRTHWETDIEGLVASKGDVVLLSHDMVSWSNSGRMIDGGDHFTIYLDADVPQPASANSAVLGIRYPNGHYETYMVSAVDGNKVSLKAPIPSSADNPLPSNGTYPACDYMWFYDSAASPGRKVKIVDVVSMGSEGFKFTAIDYTNDYFLAESNPYIYHRGFSSTTVDLGSTVTEHVVGLNVIEGRRLTRENVRLPTANASWMALLNAEIYLFKYKNNDGGTWREIRTEYQDVSFDAPKGIYDANVTAVLKDGRLTQPSPISFTIEDAAFKASDVFGLKADISNNGVIISWDDSLDPDYVKTELRFGATFETAEVITEVKGNTFLSKWLPAGNNRFWARHWNPSLPSATAASVNLNVAPPSDVKISRSSMQVNALSLSWEDAKTSQPIKSYTINIGSITGDITTATFYGKAGADSRSDVIIFTSGGDFRVFMSVEDVAGNISNIRHIDVTAALPANFAIALNYDASRGAVLSNAEYIDGELLMPLNTTETWDQHFKSRHWSTVQDQINAHFPIYFEPGTESASLVSTKDLGKILSAATISVRIAQSHHIGNVSAKIKIEWSSNNASWTSAPEGAIEVQTNNVRYIRISIFATGQDRDDLIVITSIDVDIRVEDKTESGRFVLKSTDTNGTIFTPTKKWLDIVSAIVTPQNSPAIARTNVIIDDSGSTPVVKVMAWDTHNVRIGGTVSILLGGY